MEYEPTLDWTIVRRCSNGRLEVHCPKGHYMWPTDQEFMRLLYCGHCVGWWTFNGTVAQSGRASG